MRVRWRAALALLKDASIGRLPTDLGKISKSVDVHYLDATTAVITFGLGTTCYSDPVPAARSR
jgi:hypothetical protein